MGKYRFFLLEIKRNMTVFGRFMILFISIPILTVIMAFFAGQVVPESGSESDNTVKVGIILESEGENSKILIGFLNQLKSIKSFCRLETGKDYEIYPKMERGYYSMVIDMPEDFFEKADHMEETSFKVYARKNIATEKLIALFSSAERVMVTAEAGIMSVYGGMEKYTFTLPKHQMEELLTEKYVMQFLNRDEVFDTEFLSAYGGYTVWEYMTFGLILSFVILCLSIFFNQQDEQVRMVERLLSGGFWGRLCIDLLKSAAFMLPLFILFVFLLSGAWAADIIEFDTVMLTACLLAAVVLSVYMVMMVRLLQNSAHKKSLFLIINILGIVISGLVVSGIYLPDYVREAGRICVFSVLHRLLLNLSFGGSVFTVIFYAAFYSVIMLLITAVAEYRDRI